MVVVRVDFVFEVDVDTRATMSKVPYTMLCDDKQSVDSMVAKITQTSNPNRAAAGGRGPNSSPLAARAPFKLPLGPPLELPTPGLPRLPGGATPCG